MSAQSESNDSPDVSGGLLAGGIFPPELFAGNSLLQVKHMLLLDDSYH